MTEIAVDTLLSVRGDARLDVAPDLATVQCSVRVSETSKAAALQLASAVLGDVLRALGELGGAPERAGDRRRPLAWAACSTSTRVETIWRNKEEREMPTGRVLADVDLRLEVRDFALLTGVAAALAGSEDVHVNHVAWSVDADNPAWPQVRAAAIAAALAKGRDYATALGGSLTRIEHVADVGLLGGAGPHRYSAMAGGEVSGRSQSTHRGDSPPLDPVPQEIVAVIDARFVASVAAIS